MHDYDRSTRTKVAMRGSLWRMFQEALDKYVQQLGAALAKELGWKLKEAAGGGAMNQMSAYIALVGPSEERINMHLHLDEGLHVAGIAAYSAAGKPDRRIKYKFDSFSSLDNVASRLVQQIATELLV